MREILFRGKRKDNGEWVQGHNVFYMQSNDNVFITQTGLPVPTPGDGSSVVVMMHLATEVWIDTVCQFTGLTDKNGKKIFEGDIMRNAGNVVEFCDDGFCINGDSPLSFWKDTEVIGNIHDNQSF